MRASLQLVVYHTLTRLIHSSGIELYQLVPVDRTATEAMIHEELIGELIDDRSVLFFKLLGMASQYL